MPKWEEKGRNRKFGSFLDKSGKKGQKWTKLPKTYPKGTKVDITGKNRKKGEIMSHYGPDLLKNRNVTLYLWGIV
jgi:hypothetical protein